MKLTTNSVGLEVAFPKLDLGNPTQALRESMFNDNCTLYLSRHKSSLTEEDCRVIKLHFLMEGSSDYIVMCDCNEVTSLAELDKLLYEEMWLGAYGLRSDIMRGGFYAGI